MQTIIIRPSGALALDDGLSRAALVTLDASGFPPVSCTSLAVSTASVKLPSPLTPVTVTV